MCRVQVKNPKWEFDFGHAFGHHRVLVARRRRLAAGLGRRVGGCARRRHLHAAEAAFAETFSSHSNPVATVAVGKVSAHIPSKSPASHRLSAPAGSPVRGNGNTHPREEYVMVAHPPHPLPKQTTGRCRISQVYG